MLIPSRIIDLSGHDSVTIRVTIGSVRVIVRPGEDSVVEVASHMTQPPPKQLSILDADNRERVTTQTETLARGAIGAGASEGSKRRPAKTPRMKNSDREAKRRAKPRAVKNDAPAVELPDAPAVELPDAPAVELPDAPAVELPDAPAVELPDAPAVELPDAPAVELPDAPAVELPDAPAVELPDAPAVELPDAPAVELPDAPAVELPDAPAVELPDAPAVELPDAPAPSDILFAYCLTDSAAADEARRGAWETITGAPIAARFPWTVPVIEGTGAHTRAVARIAEHPEDVATTHRFYPMYSDAESYGCQFCGKPITRETVMYFAGGTCGCALPKVPKLPKLSKVPKNTPPHKQSVPDADALAQRALGTESVVYAKHDGDGWFIDTRGAAESLTSWRTAVRALFESDAIVRARQYDAAGALVADSLDTMKTPAEAIGAASKPATATKPATKPATKSATKRKPAKNSKARGR